MKTELILVGKTNDKHFQAGIDDYAGRITHYLPFQIVTLPDLKQTKKSVGGAAEAEGGGNDT